MFSSALGIFCLLPTGLVSAIIHNINVGGPNGEIRYDPNQVHGANPGDIVRFHFQQKNHTATQSTLTEPCTPLHGGFDSGFQPVPPGQIENFPSSDYHVKDINPVWFYCRQGNHCQQGMVFAVNPYREFHRFEKNAKAIGTGSSGVKPPPTPPYGSDGSSGVKPPPPPPPGSDGSSGVKPPPPPPPSETGSSAVKPVVLPPPGPDGSSGVKPPPPPPPGETGSSAVKPPPPPPPSHDWTPTKGYYAPQHTVIVGGEANFFFPNSIGAKPGETVKFEFRQKNHTLTQSSFDQPCSKLHGGFDTGFRPVPPEQHSHFPYYTFTVHDTKPVWAYCRQTGHCKGGMVFAINPEPGQLDAFVSKAKAS